MIMNDYEILTASRLQDMISPYVLGTNKDERGNKVISYGVTSYGYDIRIGREFRIFSQSSVNQTIIDPKAFDPNICEEVIADDILIPPNSFALCRTIEHFKIPRDVLAVCVGKSTYARCGLIVNVTPLEPEWEGYLTVELSNSTPLPIKVYANEGIAQLLFFKGNPCITSYKDKNGKYQGQTANITLPIV